MTDLPARKWNAESNIVLIGMPGAGKSTVGRRLASGLEMPFVDTDDLLARRMNCTLQQLVDWRGVSNFREAERAAICEMNVKSHVISTGGSVVYSDQAMQKLCGQGLIVFLKISLATVRSRLAAADNRGLVKYPSDTIAGLFRQRAALYQRWADVTLDNDLPLTQLRLDQFAHLLSCKLKPGEG